MVPFRARSPQVPLVPGIVRCEPGPYGSSAVGQPTTSLVALQSVLAARKPGTIPAMTNDPESPD
jgi:hypothetical protein